MYWIRVQMSLNAQYLTFMNRKTRLSETFLDSKQNTQLSIISLHLQIVFCDMIARSKIERFPYSQGWLTISLTTFYLEYCISTTIKGFQRHGSGLTWDNKPK